MRSSQSVALSSNKNRAYYNDRVVRCFHHELQGGRQRIRRVDTHDEAETNNSSQDKLGSWRKHFDSFIFYFLVY